MTSEQLDGKWRYDRLGGEFRILSTGKGRFGFWVENVHDEDIAVRIVNDHNDLLATPVDALNLSDEIESAVLRRETELNRTFSVTRRSIVAQSDAYLERAKTAEAALAELRIEYLRQEAVIAVRDNEISSRLQQARSARALWLAAKADLAAVRALIEKWEPDNGTTRKSLVAQQLKQILQSQRRISQILAAETNR